MDLLDHRYSIISPSPMATHQTQLSNIHYRTGEGIWLAARRQIQTCPGMLRASWCIKCLSFSPCLLCSQKLWPFFSEEPLLQEVEPGIQCPEEDQEWQRGEQWDVRGEGQRQELQCAAGRYGSGLACLGSAPVTCIFLGLFGAFLCCVLIVLCHCRICTLWFPEEGSRERACLQMCVSTLFPQLYEEGDTAGSPQCNSSICFFNNSAADCISPPVHH